MDIPCFLSSSIIFNQWQKYYWHLNGLTTAWEEAGVAGKTPCKMNHLDEDDFDYYCDDFYDDFMMIL